MCNTNTLACVTNLFWPTGELDDNDQPFNDKVSLLNNCISFHTSHTIVSYLEFIVIIQFIAAQ